MGYIYKERDENDKRFYKLYSTTLGKEKYPKIKQKFHKLENLVSEGITKEEKELFYKVMIKIKNNLNEGSLWLFFYL